MAEAAGEEEPEAPEAQPEEATEPAAAPKPRRSTGFIVAAVLAALFAASTVVLAIIATSLKADRDAAEDDRREVGDAAGRFVEALVDYDYTDEASLRDDVVPLSADPFTEQFEASVDQLQTLNESLGRSSRATIRDVFVASVEGDEATVIVVYDSVESFTNADPIPYQNVYLRLGLVRLSGAWKVNDVLNLNFALSQAGGTDEPSG